MFTNKTVLITGAAVGIGRGCAFQFARNNANVILVDHNAETLAKTEADIKKITDRVASFVCNIADPAAVSAMVEKASAVFGGVDILVNNAAKRVGWAPFTEVDMEEWKQFFDVNMMGVVYVTRAVIEGMLERRYGRIINVASVAGVYGNGYMTPYSATKGALIAFTRALAKEVADKGITVNATSPGSVSPSENADIDFVEPTDLSFSGRTGTDRENADLICFLASDHAAYISGQNIQIDGCRKKQ